MKYRNPKSYLCLCVTLVTVGLLATNVQVQASPILILNDQRNIVNFESLQPGDAVWGNSSIVASAPAQPHVNPSSVVMTPSGTDRRAAFSPSQTVSPSFDIGDTLYFSAWIYMINSSTSGARIQIASENTGGSTSSGKLGGFGIMDTSTDAFSFYTIDSEGTGAWIQSETKATRQAWYEVVMAIEINTEDVSKSLGYLFVRNHTAGETGYTLIEDLAGIEMSWFTEEHNPANSFQYWRVENFRNGAQVDNLIAGTAVMNIPEPGSVVSVLGGLLIGGILLRRIRASRGQ